MTSVIAQHAWPDGATTTIEVEVENDYPDALSEARATAVRGLAEAVAALSESEE